MNRGELKTYIKRNIGDTIADIFDDTYLNLMLYQEVLDLQEWVEGADQMYFLKTPPLDVSMGSNDKEISLPSDFNKLISLRSFRNINDVNDGGVPIDIISLRDRSTHTSNHPSYGLYRIHNKYGAYLTQDKIIYEHPLGFAHTARVEYSYTIADLNDDSEVWSAIPAQWHAVIALGVIVKALSSEDSDSRQWERRLTAARDNMIFSLERRNKTGPRYVNMRG